MSAEVNNIVYHKLCCNFCGAITSHGSRWRFLSGKVAKSSTAGLVDCACRLVRYCSAECKYYDLSKHKIACITSNLNISRELALSIITTLKVTTGIVFIIYKGTKDIEVHQAYRDQCDYLKVNFVSEIGLAEFLFFPCVKEDAVYWQSNVSRIRLQNLEDPISSLVPLALDMIENNAYEIGFPMIASLFTPETCSQLVEIIFPQAIQIMQKKGLHLDEFFKFAKTVGFTDDDVRKSLSIEDHQDLFTDIEKKREFHRGQLQKVQKAMTCLNSGKYERAFQLVQDCSISQLRFEFVKQAIKHMVETGVPHQEINKQVSLMGLTYDEIVKEYIACYSLMDLNFACALAKNSTSPDYYFEYLVYKLIDAHKIVEAASIISKISSESTQDALYELLRS